MPRVAKSAAFRSPRRQLLSGVQADGFTGLSPCALSVSGGHGLQPCHVAQEIAALCSFAFILRAAMLEVLRSGSLFSS